MERSIKRAACSLGEENNDSGKEDSPKQEESEVEARAPQVTSVKRILSKADRAKTESGKYSSIKRVKK